VLIAVALSAFIVLAASRVFELVANYERSVPTGSAGIEKQLALEETLTKLISSAYISSDTTRLTTYLVASSSSGVSETSDKLVFTTIGVQPPQSLLGSDLTTEDANKLNGPYGGITEVAISTLPVGTPAQTVGLFLRKQTPADGDPTQGGFETNLSPDVEFITFEFFDGTEWVKTWDTTNGQNPLPTGIRVTYKYSDEPETRSFYVRLVHASQDTQTMSTGGTGTP
jgi:hypothetical protein